MLLAFNLVNRKVRISPVIFDVSNLFLLFGPDWPCVSGLLVFVADKGD